MLVGITDRELPMFNNKSDLTAHCNSSKTNQPDRQELLAIWRDDFGADPPSHLSLDFLLRAVAFERQLKSGNASERKITHDFDRLASKGVDGKRMPTKAALSECTQLIREWNGVVHKVDVVEGGYRYRDEAYKSLSAIAREITGTRWSGPRFFGVRG